MITESDQNSTGDDWLNQLADAFDQEGTIGGQLRPLIEFEEAHARHVITTFHGYQILSDSFFAFFFMTINKAAEQLVALPEGEHPSLYRDILLMFASSFKGLRAAEYLLQRGYPTVGFGLLRDLKDRAITMSAVISGKTDYLRSQGYERAVNRSGPLTDEDEEEIRRARRNEEGRIRKILLGNEGSLPQNVRDRFLRWERTFHLEVHGGRFTYFTDILSKNDDSEEFTVLPIPRRGPIGMFMNSSIPIKWMWVRLLPFLQTEPNCFGNEWLAQWNTIDRAFAGAIESWADVQEGDLPATVERVIRELFDFDAGSTHYVPRELP